MRKLKTSSGFFEETRKIEVEIPEQMAGELEQRGLNISLLLRDLLGVHLGREHKLLEMRCHGKQIEEPFLDVTEYDEHLVKAILKAFQDVECSIESLKARGVRDLYRAIGIRLYIIAPRNIHQRVSRDYITYIVRRDERLSFLRPYLDSIPAIPDKLPEEDS